MFQTCAGQPFDTGTQSKLGQSHDGSMQCAVWHRTVYLSCEHVDTIIMQCVCCDYVVGAHVLQQMFTNIDDARGIRHAVFVDVIRSLEVLCALVIVNIIVQLMRSYHLITIQR